MMRAASADVLVVGAGVIGLFIARELLAAGASVTVVDRGVAGGEASWAGGGILSPLHPWRYPAAVDRLARASQRSYPAIAAELHEDVGIDAEWTRSGMLVLGSAEAAAARDWAARTGATLEIIRPGAAQALQPGLEPQADPIWLPEVAQIRNPRLTAALRADILRRGATLREGVAVTGLRVENDRVHGLRSGDEPLHAGQVVIAAGAWTSVLLGELAPQPPVAPVRGQMLLLRAAPGAVQRIVLHESRYLVPRRDGRVLVGSTLEQAGFDKNVTPQARDDLLAAAARLLPTSRDFVLERHWAGLRPGSPQGIPLIGAHPQIAGLYLCAGHFRNGITLAPASARLLADLLLARPPQLDPAPYRPRPAVREHGFT